MNFLKKLVLGFAICALPLTANAIIAKRGVRTVTQPDGSTLNIKVIGDEHLHFTTDEDGNLLYLNDDGFYTYAEIADDGAVISNGKRVSKSPEKADAVNISDLNIKELVSKRVKNRARAPQTGVGLVSSTFPTKGSPKSIIILVEFSDLSFKLTDPANYFTEMITGTDFKQYGGTGSAYEYFRDQSDGKFTPDFDVYGPVKLSKSYTYYGKNDRYGNDMYPDQMVTDAVKILDPDVDFSQYDTDGDGVIDNIYVFYAGQGESSGGNSNTIWPHSWDVRSAGTRLTVDNVLVGHYACSNEWEGGQPDGVGTFIHEFSHVMGLPDLYDIYYDKAYSSTPGSYSVLDYGPYNNNGRTPPNYGAYELNAMGWREPIMMDSPMNVSLNPIKSGEFGLIPTAKNSEFFLFENRQQEGWDRYIPYHGMLIWHIDYNKSVFDRNEVNISPNHQYVDIEEANNKPNNNNSTYMKGWPFPGTGGNTSFTAQTTPALKAWDGTAIDLPVTDIEEVNGIIYFKVAGGNSSMATPEPDATLVETGDRAFIASWEPVEGATDYFISVYVDEERESGEISTGFDNSTLSEGWTASSTGYYTTSGNYGAKAPSFKFSTMGQTLTSPVLKGSVSQLTFWVKGQSTDDVTNILVEGGSYDNWVNIGTCYPVNGSGQYVTAATIPQGVSQIRFTFNKSRGNVAVDDIKISYSASPAILPSYNRTSTNGLTSMLVDKLVPNVNKYYFTVQATDGTSFSPISNPVYVELLGIPSGIENIATEKPMPVEYYNLQGIRIENPAQGSIVIRRQGNKVSKVIIK